MALTEQASELELENLLIGYEGRVEAERIRDKALLTRIGGKFARFRGKAAKRAGVVRAGASLLSSFATAKGLGMLDGGGGAAPATLTTTRGPTGMGF